MTIKNTKVAIVGTGLVGSSTAFSLVTQGVCDEVLMTDINKERAIGEAMDLNHSIEYLNRNVKVKAADYSEYGDVDVVVITAGAPPKPGQTRLDTLGMTADIVKSIVNPIMESGFKGFFIIVSNPADIIAYYVYKLSGLPKSHVLSTGTSIDTARLKNFIGELVDVDPRSVQGYSMGEHGDSQIVPWSHITVGGKSFLKVLEDNKDRFPNVDLKELVKDTAEAGWEVYKRKGTTYYAIATATVGIIKAILNNENRIIPVSTFLEGEYGVNGVFAGVPAILNSNGVKEVVEIHLNEEEENNFKNSINVIKEYVEKLENR
ncbi:L-lactate dehydrogenase [Clostridium thermobutyricum]|uniref:L-lactate dehydrogenase n=1 Tax=Clostridium thermobutyricum DSM 4928 TaxID=1121339 RepID=A0A1V4STK6_9CLOT|nr:L-lactate dehydrogenase [Clostridium thermobutyricum]OPX46631.1 L-lactate dehydrogenase 2 [Clostridium thermobutyricum DSM 4928]